MDKTLIDQLQDRNPQKRRAATYKMGKSKDPGYVSHLIKVYDDPDATVRQNVIDALGLLGTNEANEFLHANAAERVNIKNNLSRPQPAAKRDDSDPTAFIDDLIIDRRGLNTVLDRMDFATPEVQALVQAKLTKMFGERALDWWEAIAKDREITSSKSMTTLAIPAPAPGNLGGRLAVAGAIGLLTGNMNAGVLAASSGDNLLINEKIKIPSTCSLCGVNEGTRYKAVTKDVVFSELGAAIGGNLMGQKKVELQAPVCALCAGLSISPGVYLVDYLKVEKDWKIILSVANSAIAERYINMNPGSLIMNIAAPVSPSSAVQDSGVKPEPGSNVGTIEIHRNPKTTGFMYKVKILIDGKQVGALGGNETSKFTIPSGVHTLRVEGGGLSKTTSITICDSQHLRFRTEFSDAGFLGGGLKLEMEPPAPA